MHWNDLFDEKQILKQILKNIENKNTTINNNIKINNNTEFFPQQKNIFRAFALCPFDDLKVVILGQDPYHTPKKADGLAFSTPNSENTPPSLRNILKELSSDLGILHDNDLSNWAKQGILLLNTVLTVEPKIPNSHANLGWENFTDSIIIHINNKNTAVVFVLWGNYAKSKKKLITNPIHHIIENVHPSPLSAYRGFFGSKPFSAINQFTHIDWEK